MIMTSIFWIASALFLAFFAFMFFTNWRLFYYNYVKRTAFTSVVPMVGGIAGCIGLLLLPVDGANDFWWVPLLIEWGSAPVILFSIGWHVFRSK